MTTHSNMSELKASPGQMPPQLDVESQKDASIEQTAHVVDAIAERALCRKFDLRLLPVLAVMVSQRQLQCDPET